ncbi:MAG: hypothetical protein ABJB40_05455, partial [Acidobacteriota bacterium]
GCNREGRTETSGFQKKLTYSGETEMKKTLTVITLAIVLMFGATFANAGIIVGDRPSTDTCNSSKGIIILRSGIIILAATAITGIIVGDEPTDQCKDDTKATTFGIIIL